MDKCHGRFMTTDDPSVCRPRNPQPTVKRSAWNGAAIADGGTVRRFRLMMLGAGLLSLIWFLIRVIPKPSRAAYPCQRAAAPLASGFVLWLLGVFAAMTAWRKGREFSRNARNALAWACAGVALLAAIMVVVSVPRSSLQAGPPEMHGPMGVGKGIHPGRVVWVHAPDATDWAGYHSTEPWWWTNHTDLAVVEEMMSQAVRGVAGEANDATAWASIFEHFNEVRGNGRRGYERGEKIAIKINMTTCNGADPAMYEKPSRLVNAIDNSPQMLLALLRQLVYVAGVAPGDISMGDPTGLFPNYMWNALHPEFPDVQYFDTMGGQGRVRTEFSAVPFYWSTTAATGKRPDRVPLPFARANYLINFAVLKGHSSGITVCGKNHYGSLLRTPVGGLRGVTYPDYYNMHLSLPNAEWSPGMGQYRATVDLMGHRELGGKTLLYLVDGLFGGYYWDAHPYPWNSAPFGDGTTGDWPSSLFASQDPVAIDSVAHDFLLAEWPNVVTGGVNAPGSLQGGAEDYLHEAALAHEPPSGTHYDPEGDDVRLESLGVHEHWNNAQEKLYSRNLGLDTGIELVPLSVSREPPRLNVMQRDGGILLSWRASHFGYQLESTDRLKASEWLTLTNMPLVHDAQNVVSDAPGGSNRFYRLRK